jgi:serine/threonine protein kinase
LRERLQISDVHAPLTWVKRINISLVVVQGIEYLHDMAHKSFIHKDLKSTNILLDQDLIAKVSDFGLVRIDGDKSFTSKRAGIYGHWRN